MKKRAAGAIGAVLLASALLSGQTPQGHFYDRDKEIRIEGLVRDIRFEPRYENAQRFLVLQVEERTTKRMLTVEISPAWFFSQDLHAGEPIRVVGSLAGEGGSVLIAREVQCRGETIAVRDSRGFPNWRGGQGPRRKRGPAG